MDGKGVQGTVLRRERRRCIGRRSRSTPTSPKNLCSGGAYCVRGCGRPLTRKPFAHLRARYTRGAVRRQDKSTLARRYAGGYERRSNAGAGRVVRMRNGHLPSSDAIARFD
jgi:hypothetical protein